MLMQMQHISVIAWCEENGENDLYIYMSVEGIILPTIQQLTRDVTLDKRGVIQSKKHSFYIQLELEALH